MKRQHFGELALLVTLILPALSLAATRTISPGDNVQSAIGQLRPGDTLLLRKGTYNVGPLGCPPSGTGSARVTIAGDPKDGQRQAVLMVGDRNNNGITMSDCAYITFDNLVIDAKNAGYAGVKPTGNSHHIRVSNSEVRNAPTQGILTHGAGHEFLGLDVHDNGTSEQFDHGLYIVSSETLIDGCDIHNNTGFGIQIYNEGAAVNRVTLRNNRIHDNRWGAVLGSGADHLAYNNLIYNNRTMGVTVKNGGQGIQVFNNSFYHNGEMCLENADADNTTMRNNICFGHGNNTIVHVSGDNLALSNNMAGDPKWVNPGAGDFHLQNDSPAIKAGMELRAVFSTDFTNAQRPSGAFDLGAYAAGQASTTRPPAPRNLRVTAVTGR